MKNVLSFSVLATVLSMGLYGCGSSDDVGAPGVPAIGANDTVYNQVLPQLQNQYGNIIILDQVTIAGTVLTPGRSMTWAELYSPYVLQLVSECGCTAQVQYNPMGGSYGGSYGGYSGNPGVTQPSGLAGVDYQAFRSREIYTHTNDWGMAAVKFTRSSSGSIQTFLWTVDAMMTGGVSYNNTYNPQYSQYYGSQYYPMYPQNSINFYGTGGYGTGGYGTGSFGGSGGFITGQWRW